MRVTKKRRGIPTWMDGKERERRKERQCEKGEKEAVRRRRDEEGHGEHRGTRQRATSAMNNTGNF